MPPDTLDAFAAPTVAETMTDQDHFLGDPLPRYGCKDPGTLPLERMPDGYWTPWHFADAELAARDANLKLVEVERGKVIDALRAEISDLKHDIERQQTACSEHLGEIERLLAFVAAWDAHEMAAQAWGRASGLELHATDLAFDETFRAMLAAREAIGKIS